MSTISFPDWINSLSPQSTDGKEVYQQDGSTPSRGDLDDKASLSGANFTDMPQVGGDEIVERGSNSDSDFVRFADGTQIAYSSTDSVSINGSETNFGDITWGQEFISDPIISTPWLSIGTSDDRFASQFVVGGTTNNSISTTGLSDINVIRFGDFGTNPSGQNGTVYIIAIGRWK